jgi:serine/threonine protein kinase
MIRSVSENPADGTQHVPDGPVPATETQFVPDGTLISRASGPVRVAEGSGVRSQTGLPTFGRFRAVAELGAGSMGTVYRAQDDVLGRAVAIKALHARDASTRERFLREARAIGAVLHPNILAVYDAATDDNQPYLVMELAAGGSLRERIAAGALPIEAAREVGIQIARALAAAHGAGIVHRDIKPANILDANDTWKLADFGIARLPDSTLTVEGQFLGSPSYAAPESLRAGDFSPASDVYGLGATLYEALAGVPPHGNHDIQSLIRKLEQDPPPLSSRRPVPRALEQAIMATLARDPTRRPTADELARLLAVNASETVVLPPLPLHAMPGPSTRTKLIALGLAAVAIVLVALAITRDKPANAEQSKPPVAQPVAKPRSVDPKPNKKAKRDKPVAEPRKSVPATPYDPWANTRPDVVDEHGNPVDDETARQILEQMRRDAESEYNGIDRGRKRNKRRRD